MNRPTKEPILSLSVSLFNRCHILLCLAYEMRVQPTSYGSQTLAKQTECVQLVNWNYCRMASTQIRDIVCCLLFAVFIARLRFCRERMLNAQIYQHHGLASFCGVSFVAMFISVHSFSGCCVCVCGIGNGFLAGVAFEHIFLSLKSEVFKWNDTMLSTLTLAFFFPSSPAAADVKCERRRKMRSIPPPFPHF